MPDVLKIQADDAPDMVAILLCVLLFKLGGQITLTLGEIQKIHAEFPEIRFALTDYSKVDPFFKQENETVTATLRSRDHMENDRLKDKL